MDRRFFMDCMAIALLSACLIALGASLGYSAARTNTPVVQAVPTATPYAKPLCLELYAKPDGEPDYLVKTCPVVPR